MTIDDGDLFSRRHDWDHAARSTSEENCRRPSFGGHSTAGRLRGSSGPSRRQARRAVAIIALIRTGVAAAFRHRGLRADEEFSADDQQRLSRMSQDLRRLASEEHGRNAAPAVRGHDNQVASARFGDLQDNFVG